MIMMRSVCLVVASVALAAALPASHGDRVAFETDVPPLRPQGWHQSASFALGSGVPNTIELVFAVRQSNVDSLFQKLEDVSRPDSPTYGDHLSQQAVSEMVAPDSASVQAVMDFLESHGATSQCASPNCDFVTATVSIAQANALLDANYQPYVHTAGPTLFSTDAYSLPASVAPHVDFVAPTKRLPPINTPTAASAAGRKLLGGGGGGGNTPATLRTRYSIGSVEGTGATKQAATGFLNQYFKPSDLQKFYTNFYKVAEGRTIAAKGDKMGSSAGVEASLDVDYISSVGGNVTTEFWSFAGHAPSNPQNEPFLKWMLLVGNTSDAEVPHVFSTSYGEDEASVSVAYADRINVEFAKAGTRGISLMFASGDDGVGSDCKDDKFDSKWPAASPYVTAVGGTEPGSPSSTSSESAAGLSSGGFSNRYAQPSWQKAAVATYLKGSSVPTSKFNATGRGFPDVSAQAVSFTVVNNGMTLPGVAGTSAACPTFSGVIGLLNDLRKSSGKKTLGFLNPWIYQNAAAFNDITSGSNPGCDTQGFPAEKGWDPVTGVGTPNYAAMAKALP